ncbi:MULTISPECIES: IclR family transcriptional regulator [Labrys]|uniref:IclR family transcriptional regulator n=1 Tax=Labrys TaxID=204476 RepID=UPI001FE031D2|nr:IclR family transcriptional regulator [Labrys okinawensis]
MTAKDDGEDRYKAPALDKGLDILELLSGIDEGLSLAEIAKALDRSQNEIYRMLDRLVRRNYVIRTPSDRFELSLKLFDLAHRHPPMRRLVSLALRPMRLFAREAEQACHLTVYARGSGVVVAQIDAPDYWGISVRVGTLINLLNTGSGHILLAYASDEERELMLGEREHVPNETWPERLDEVLASVRERGWEMRPSQQAEGVTNISVPVFGVGGRLLAALTCPRIRRLLGRPRSEQQILELLQASASQISAAARIN